MDDDYDAFTTINQTIGDLIGVGLDA